MSRSDERGFGVRSLAVLSGIMLAVAVGLPAAAQDAPDSREARGSIRQMQHLSAQEGWVLTDAALLLWDLLFQSASSSEKEKPRASDARRPKAPATR